LWTRSFATICLAHLTITVGFYSTMPVYALFLEDSFHLQGLTLGVSVAVYTFMAIVSRPPTGYCLDRFGRRTIYLTACALFALNYFLYPLAGGLVSVTLVRMLHGVLWGVAVGAAGTAAVDALPPERRGEGIGYFGFAMILGMSLGPTLGTYVADTWGYHELFIGVGLFNAAGFFLLLTAPFPVVPRSRRPLTLAAMLEKSSLPVSACTLLYCIAYGVIMNYTGMYARTLPGASAGAFFLCLALGTALSRLRSGAIFDSRGPGGVMGLGYALLLAGFVCLAFSGNALLFTGSGLVIGMGFGITTPVLQAMINALVPPERRGAANATMMTAFDLGNSLGILGMSWVIAQAGWRATFVGLCLAVLLSLLVFLLIALPRYTAAKKT
jgi:predicted MFS family arabinose efflux permease